MTLLPLMWCPQRDLRGFVVFLSARGVFHFKGPWRQLDGNLLDPVRTAQPEGAATDVKANRKVYYATYRRQERLTKASPASQLVSRTKSVLKANLRE